MYNSKTYYGKASLDEKDLEETSINYKIELEYYGVEKDKNSYLKEDLTSYGIEIVKKEYKEEKVDIETNYIENISDSSSKIIEIINTLKEHKVTPICLDDVLEDLLKQKMAE